MTMYGASGVIVASQESHSKRVFVGELNKDSGPAPSEFRWLESASRDAKIYLDDFPGSVCYAARDGDRWTTLALDDTGRKLPVEQIVQFSQLQQVRPFGGLIAVSFLFGREWRGRVFLFNPSWRGEKQEELRFFCSIWFARWGRQSTKCLPSAPVTTAGGSRRTRSICAGIA